MKYHSYAKFSFTVAFILLFMGIQTTVFASDKYDLRFKTGPVAVSQNLDEFINHSNVSANEMFGDFYFRIIQFHDIPSNETKTRLVNAGIRLTGYFPNYAYFSIIDKSANLEVLRTAGARAVVEFQPVWKLNKQLKNGDYPNWATASQGQIDLVVRYYKGLNGDDVQAALLASGSKIIKRYDYSSWIEIRANVNQLMNLAALPFVSGLEPIAPPSTPDDERGRSLHRSSTINTYSPMGRHYDGTGVSVALADDGPVGPHIDYEGRIDQSNTGGAGNGTHGDMTAGILMGGGNLNPTMRGMGTGAFIYIYDIGGYNHILNSPTTNQTLGVLVTSTSYSQGCNEYTSDTQTGDQILHENPTLLHVYSAGNNGSGNCQYGAGAGWGNITGGYKQGKNVIACGNLNYLDVLENSSSRGPAEDGRIKPDICANGINQMSTNGPNTYQVGGGTSAACPGIAGIITQLHQAYRDLNGGTTAEGALIKASMLNTAEDLGNPGPDFRHGWGRVNALRAVTTLEENRYEEALISQGDNQSYTLTVPSNTKQMRLMIYWTDVEGDPLAAKALVNDINMIVTDPSSTTFEPWVLNPAPNAATLNAVAVRGVDDLNNMEQVTIDDPAAGDYTVDVSGFLIPQGPQKYYLVYEFVDESVTVTYPIGYEGFVPGETETIRWDAFGTSGTFTVEYSTDLGSNWNSIANNVSGAQRYFNWTVPNILTGEAIIRVSRAAQSGQSTEAFSIIGLPANIQVDWACPDSIRLVWNAVAGAIGYEVSMLGAMYMDSIAFSSTNSAILTGINPLQSYWFSVRAYTPDNTKGRRANAVFKNAGVFGCPIMIDASVTELVSPKGDLQDCQDLSNYPITINVENKGLNPISNIPVLYSVNNTPAVSETINTTLASFATTTYTFNTTFDFSTLGVYDLKVWTDYVADGNHFNDTVQSGFEVVPGVIATLPYSENFESFTLCATATNCEQTVCGLTNGWFNLTNTTSDQIDWRTDNNGTASANTGPVIDHNPGTAAGKYLYLEASVCFQREAIAVSPCFDLTSATSPLFEFWYHMWGADMGELHVDVFANDIWNNDVMPVLSGNQGNSWQMASVDMSAYAGQIINIRFRGITGPDYTSDMAIDNINFYETSAPPVTNFTASATSICVGQTITLIDLSQNNPTTWDWNILPATGYTYVNGTNSNSQNPQVQFTAMGIYDVSLTSSNTFGSSNVTFNSYISVGAGAVTPLIETFQSGIFPPSNWSLDNGDGLATWQLSGNITGSIGTTTNAAYMNNFSYNAAGQEDGLITERVDLNGTMSPYVTFDVSHARYSASFIDGLRVDVSTDCGVTYVPTGYFKQGTTLATAPDQTSLFTPTAAGQWRNDTIDLTGFIGSEISLKFVNITGYGNSLYIDNINYKDGLVGVNELPGNLLSIDAFPNPGTGVFNISVGTKTAGTVSLKVTDVKGASVLSETISIGAGMNNVTVDISKEGKGVYILEIQNESESRNIKLVIL